MLYFIEGFIETIQVLLWGHTNEQVFVMDFHDIQKGVHGVKVTEGLCAMVIKDQMRRLSAYIVLVRNPPSMRSYCNLI